MVLERCARRGGITCARVSLPFETLAPADETTNGARTSAPTNRGAGGERDENKEGSSAYRIRLLSVGAICVPFDVRRWRWFTAGVAVSM